MRWIAELLGLPDTTEGLLVSGGNMANFHCFLAARRAKGGEALREDGPAPRRPAAPGVRLDGDPHLDPEGRRPVRPRDAKPALDPRARRPHDRRGRARSRRSRRTGARGTGRSCSWGTRAPSARGRSTRSPALAEIARAHDLWFHVDGAYGAPARGERRGAARAHRARARPTRWPSIRTSGSTRRSRPAARWCATRAPCATPSATRRRTTASTARSEDPRTNYFELGLQNSRGFRALKVWLGLRQAGRDGYAGDDRGRHPPRPRAPPPRSPPTRGSRR